MVAALVGFEGLDPIRHGPWGIAQIGRLGRYLCSIVGSGGVAVGLHRPTQRFGYVLQCALMTGLGMMSQFDRLASRRHATARPFVSGRRGRGREVLAGCLGPQCRHSTGLALGAVGLGESGRAGGAIDVHLHVESGVTQRCRGGVDDVLVRLTVAGVPHDPLAEVA